MTTPSMDLSLPTVSSTLGPTWASQINAALQKIDAHDHTANKGVRLPSAALNLDAALPFNGYDATLLRTTRFSEQAAALSLSTDLGCVYNVGGDLYWNNGDGTAVQITDGAALSATSLGGISGLPSGTASAAFAAATFTFRSATNQASTMDVGPVVIRDTATSANGIKVKSPVGLASDYDLTLPAVLPAVTSFLRMTTAGVVAADVAPDGTTLEVSGSDLRVKAIGIGTAQIAALAVTRAKQAAVGPALSLGSGAYTNTTSSWTAICSTSLTVTGRPVIVSCQVDDTQQGYFWMAGTGATGERYGGLRLTYTGGSASGYNRTVVGGYYSGSAGQIAGGAMVPGAFFYVIDSLAAGTYTFTLEGSVITGTGTFHADYVILHVYEL